MGQVIDFKSRKVIKESAQEWREHTTAPLSHAMESFFEDMTTDYKTLQQAEYDIDEVDEVGIIMEILHEIKITLQNIEEALDDQS